jgi:hypothetical protein
VGSARLVAWALVGCTAHEAPTPPRAATPQEPTPAQRRGAKALVRLSEQRAPHAYYLPPGAAVSHPTAPRAAYPIKRKPLRGTVTPIAGDRNQVADAIRGRPDANRLFTAMSALMGAVL